MSQSMIFLRNQSGRVFYDPPEVRGKVGVGGGQAAVTKGMVTLKPASSCCGRAASSIVQVTDPTILGPEVVKDSNKERGQGLCALGIYLKIFGVCLGH